MEKNNNEDESDLKPPKTPDKAEGDVETVEESIRIHEEKGDEQSGRQK
jgi:hypothetical protein